jgi:isocitrate dehydrogenase (NAD+)
MAYKATLLPGDGIGPEVTEATLRVIEATGVSFEWDRQEVVGHEAVEKYGEPLPDFVVESIRTNGLALKGPITTPVGTGFKSVNVTLRQKLDLYANVRPCVSLPRVSEHFENVDLLIFRENTEGLYSGIENFDENLQIAESIARITRRGSERIIRFCFEYARRQGRRKVTLAHKANILKQTSGLFLRIGQEMASEYPDIEFNERIIDNMCMQLVIRPEEYDCIVTTNLFGDILSDLCAGLVGGLGVVPGSNIGDECAVFEAVHGSAPDIAGQGKANPTALIRTAEMMLRHIGEFKAADAIFKGLRDVYQEQKSMTGDQGGRASSKEFTDNLCDKVASYA